MRGASAINKQKRVETVIALLRVALGPGSTLDPPEEAGELRMRGNEILHRIGLLASRGGLQFVEALRGRYCEDGRIDHSAAPLLPVRRRDAYADAAYAHHCICGFWIRSAKVKASYHRILAALENGRLGKRRAIAVGLERAGETDAFGMVATISQCRAARRRQRRNQLFGC